MKEAFGTAALLLCNTFFHTNGMILKFRQKFRPQAMVFYTKIFQVISLRYPEGQKNWRLTTEYLLELQQVLGLISAAS